MVIDLPTIPIRVTQTYCMVDRSLPMVSVVSGPCGKRVVPEFKVRYVFMCHRVQKTDFPNIY